MATHLVADELHRASAPGRTGVIWFSLLLVLVLKRQQEIVHKIIGESVSCQMTDVARVAEVKATPDAGFCHLIGCF